VCVWLGRLCEPEKAVYVAKKSVTELSTAYPIRNMRDILQQTKLPVNIFKAVVKRFFADVGELKASDCRILLAEQKNKSVWFMR